MKVIIGIDPDSKAHGVAIYDSSGSLTTLQNYTLPEFYELLRCYSRYEGGVIVHIEDVCAQNAAFSKKGIKNQRAATAVNRSIGRCQQAQIELERFCEYEEVEVVKHQISKCWKSQRGKAQFEKITGWKGRSNEDTRSAAYFGWLGLKSINCT